MKTVVFMMFSVFCLSACQTPSHEAVSTGSTSTREESLNANCQLAKERQNDLAIQYWCQP